MGFSLYVAALLALSLTCLSISTSAMTFDLALSSLRCFAEEVPSDNEFVVSFKTEEAKGQFLDVIVTDPVGHIVWASEGQRYGTYRHPATPEGGDYKLCFNSRSAGWGTTAQPRKITFNFKVGMDSVDYKNLATTEKLKPIEVQLRMMEDTVRAIHGEYDYYKAREADMRSTNEHMTAKVMWMSITVIVLFVVFSYWQLRHLKKYFKKKRMID